MAIRRNSANIAPTTNTPIAHASAEGNANSPTSRRPRKLVRRMLALACLGLLVADTTGCSLTSGMCKAVQQSDCIDDFMVGYRNRALAEKAWHCRKDRFSGQTYAKEFKAGFIDGYMEVANGGPGCCPTVAPSKYCGWQYQSANGKAAINAWFAGYPMGVQAAEQEGVGHYQQIFTMGVPVNSGLSPANQGVADPFYSDEEMIPAPQMEMEMQMEMHSAPEVEVIIPPSPDAVLNSAPQAFDAEPELIARRDAALDSPSVGATLGDDSIELTAPVEMVIDDPIELLPSAPASDELPFSFE